MLYNYYGRINLLFSDFRPGKSNEFISGFFDLACEVVEVYG